MVRNFRFEEEGRIARSGYPETPEAVDWLAEQGIRTVVSLHPVPEAVQQRMTERGIRWRPFLVEDFTQGVPEGMGEALQAVRQEVERDPAVLIHCQGGGGRAGTFYAAYLISEEGLTADQALTRVSGVEKDVSRAFLRGFAAGVRAGRVD